MTASDRTSDQAKKPNPFAKKSEGGGGGAIGTIKDRTALKEAIKAFAKMPPNLKAARKAQIIKAAKAINATFMLPKDWAMTTTELAAAEAGRHACAACERTFVDLAVLAEHAEALHSFDETRTIVRDALAKEFGTPPVGALGQPQVGVYIWIAELAADWVVFESDSPAPGSTTKLIKAAYAIADDGTVSFTNPKEVVRRTVYDVVKTPAASATTSNTGSNA